MRSKVLGLLILAGITSSLRAQVSEPAIIRAFRIDESIRLDGRLDERAWEAAEGISNFTQRELNQGEPPSERTNVAIVYDDECLYIGVWCFDSRPEAIVAKEMKRDFSFWSDDNFEIIIDTYRDRRNAYLFVINPNGARADVLITDEGARENEDWNGVWDAAMRVTEEGWFSEVQIPFSTLKFPEGDNQDWGINFERNIRRKIEQVLWQGWSRDYRLEHVSQAGTLVGLRGVTSGHLAEIKPYSAAGLERLPGQRARGIGHAGGDLNYLVTSNLKLNLTANTDFAQVESDRLEINLSRFSLFFPEKREFFLEGRESFDFSLGYGTRVFYSRQIGIREHQEVPILGGARLIGKVGRTNVGALSIQADDTDVEPTTNYSVLRLKQDVLGQSYLGMIATMKTSALSDNYVYGADGRYVTSRLFGDKRLLIGGALVGSRTRGQSGERRLAYRGYLSYPSDRVEFDMAVVGVQRDFDPQMGFLRRHNYKMLYMELQFNPRPALLPWIRKMEIKPLDINYYLTDDTNEPESIGMEWRPLGFGTKSGEWFEYNIQRFFDRVDEPFTIQDVPVQAGEYWFNRQEIQAYTFRGRKISTGAELGWGDYYTGKRTSTDVTIRINVNRHLNLRADYEWNHIRLDRQRFHTHEVGGRIEYAFTPRLYTRLVSQWNNEDREVILNLRLNWIPIIGSDFYFVLNQTISTEGETLMLEDTTVLSKLVWRWAY